MVASVVVQAAGRACAARMGTGAKAKGKAKAEVVPRSPKDVVDVDESSIQQSKDAWKHDREDKYSLLGIGHLRWKATADEIKRAHRAMCVVFHPDKTESPEEDEHFKAIQEAYEFFTDDDKRRVFDSMDDFDNRIPEGTYKGDKFFEAFGPVFERNSRWSRTQPVPELGGMDKPLSEVRAFYDFWYEFQSWREIAGDDENNLDEAENRYERRQMEQENMRTRNKLKKKESARIVKLVDNAYRQDPRLLAEKMKAKEAKERVKREREEAKRKEEEAKRAAEEEAERIAAEKAAAAAESNKALKKEKEKQKKALQKARARVRNCFRDTYGEMSLRDAARHMEMIEKLCMSLSATELVDFATEWEALVEQPEAFFDKLADRYREVVIASMSDAEKTAFLEQLDREKTARGKNMDGLAARVIEARKKAAATAAAAAPSTSASASSSSSSSSATWTTAELALLTEGIKKFPAGSLERWEKVASHVGTKSAAEVLAKVKSAPQSVDANRPDDGQSDFEKFQKQLGSRPIEKDASSPAAQAPKWTAEQQKALEDGLRKFPASIGPARWDKIAVNVPDMDATACKLRFETLRSSISSKKKGGGKKKR